MKNKKPILLSIFFIVILSIFVVIANRIIQTDYSNFEQLSMDNHKKGGDFMALCQPLDSITYENFPYAQYLSDVNPDDIHTIATHLETLDSLVGNSFLAQNILSTALTKELKLQVNNLDSLNMLLNWVDNYKVYAQFAEEEHSFYESIYDYWYLYTAQILTAAIKEGKVSKFDFKYRFLAQKCEDNGYLRNEGNTLKEKVFLNIIDQNWPYLFHRFWFSTGLLFKVIVFTILGVGIGLLFFIFKCITKERNHEG